MFTQSRLTKLMLGVCIACLAVGLFGSLSRDEVSTALRRLKEAEEIMNESPESGLAGFAEVPDEKLNFTDNATGLVEENTESAESTYAATAWQEEIEVNSTFVGGFLDGESDRAEDGLPIIQFDTKIWASDRSVRGIEDCHDGATGYCNALMYRASSACRSSNCVLITNPPGHRTRTPLHIHAYHYNGAGAALKSRMSKSVCGRGGWHVGGFPCGGKAKYFHGFPPVFSVAKGAGSIRHASVTAWPGSCGGGTIVLVSFGCSIEHTISHR